MPHIVRFGSYEADLDSGQLRKRGTKIRLRYQLFQILDLLLEHPGQVISRDEFQRRLWSDDVSVDFENNLNTAIAQLREILGDSAEHPALIETLPKRGYRFIADVHDLPARTAPSPEKPLRLVVLPFVNLTGDPTQEYLSDAMTDEVITALAPLAPERLAVIARTTAMHYKGSHKDVARIGRELAVDYVIEGAVRHVNQKCELNVQAVRARDETHIFVRKYEAHWNDLFGLQMRVATDTAVQLGIVETSRSKSVVAVAPRPTPDLTAYSEYMQARFLTMGTKESFTSAREHLEKAVARDPGFAHAHDALAEVYWYLGYLGFMAPRKAFSVGLMHALRALEIDNTRAETHALVGQFHKAIDYNWPEVHREMALALRLDPNSPVVLTRHSVSELMPHGRLDEAIAELERALEFDPLSVWARFWLGIVLILRRRYDRAIEQGRMLLDIDPPSTGGHFIVGVAYGYLGRPTEAVTALQRALDSSGDVPSIMGWIGMILAASNRTSEAHAILRRLHEKAVQGYVPPTSFASIHLGLKEIDAAFNWLDHAVEECDQLIMPIKSYGFLDPIRNDPRFGALLQKMRLDS